MIDTHAVITGVNALLERKGQGGELEWLAEQLQTLPVQQGAQADGSYAVSLPGKSAKTVALGSYVGEGSGDGVVGLVISVEAVKALARRYGSELPCTLQLKLWAEEQGDAGQAVGAAPSTSGEQKAAAYLELYVEGGTGSALSMVSQGSGTGETPFHARLVALGDEAIQELTGKPALLAAGAVTRAESMARQGVPAAVMSLQLGTGLDGGVLAETGRLPVLQAAEAFGRWAEATVHLVGGDEVDLWAREHRLPHLEQH